MSLWKVVWYVFGAWRVSRGIGGVSIYVVGRVLDRPLEVIREGMEVIYDFRE